MDDPGQPDRFRGEFRAIQAAAAGGGVALGKDQTEHVEHHSESFGSLLESGQTKGTRLSLICCLRV
jgi:hypothetical protein